MQRSRVKLTKTAIDDLGTDPRYVWDTEVPRFAARVRQSGAVHYVLRIVVDGSQRWYRIGKHGDPWTVETARDEARRVLGQSENVKKLRETGSAPAGLLHPVEARERGKVVPTLATFAKRYLDEHAKPHKAAGTLAADRGLLGLREDGAEPAPEVRTILRALGSKRMDRISRSDLVALHLAWKDTPTRANRAVALLSHMFTMAEKWGVRADGTNPARHVERFKETKRERFRRGPERVRLGAALTKLEAKNRLTPWGLAAVRLLLFTGARASEVLGLTWEGGGGVNVKAGTVRLERKGRMSTIYLNPPARQVLSRLRRLKGNPYVIVGGRDGQALTLSGLEQVWQEVRMTAGLAGVRLHDLRHGFASVAAAGGASLPIIGALLGHTQAQTTARYAHLLGDPLKAASKAVGQRITLAMKGKRSAKAPPDIATGRRQRKAGR